MGQPFEGLVPAWAIALWAQQDTRFAAVMLGLAAFTAVAFKTPAQPRRSGKDKEPPPKLPRQWHWPFARKRIPWKLGPVTVDLRGGQQTIHAVVAGMSGVGKSTVVLWLLMSSKKPALVVAFDNSRPIRDLFQSRGWTIWQPGGNIGWDILKGSPQIVSEALTAGFARTSQDTGYNRGLARMRLWRTMDELDSRGIQRTIDTLIDALRAPGLDSDENRACRSWANRFESIAKSLGPSLGTDLDLADALSRRENVLILPNRFLSPEDAPIIGGIALVQARRVAQEVGDHLIIVEEAGQAGSRQVEMNALAQAGRDRGCPLIVLTQNMAKLPEEVINNVKVWISFAQESSKELAFAAERLRIDPTVLREEMLPTGTCWVRAPGLNPRRVKLPLPRFKPSATPIRTTTDKPSATDGPLRKRYVSRLEAPEHPGGILALPPPSTDVQKVLKSLYPEGECERWAGKHDKDGYGLVWLDGRWQKVHRIRWELTYGPIPLNADGTRVTLDHMRSCPRDCSRPTHLTLCSREENSRRRWRVRGVGRVQ